jgi:hypothetical protein
MASFADTFSGDLGGLVEEVVLGCGPCGELRFPAYVEAAGWRFPGVGEFVCYDRRALASLAAAARARGRPEWGHAGPHDSGEYNSEPHSTGFFASGGSWDSDYGDFFLTWYSGALHAHGERMLAAAARTLGRFQRPSRAPPSAVAVAAAAPGSPAGRGSQALLRRIQSLASGGGVEAAAAAAAMSAALAASEAARSVSGSKSPSAAEGAQLAAPSDDPGTLKSTTALEQQQQQRQQQRSSLEMVTSVFGALAGPGPGQPPAPKPQALQSWDSGSSGALLGSLARVGLDGDSAVAAAAAAAAEGERAPARRSSSSGTSGPVAGAGSGGAGGGTPPPALAGSVLSLDSLAATGSPQPAGAGAKAPPLGGLSACAGEQRLAPPLAGLLGSPDAAAAAAAPATPQGGPATPERPTPAQLALGAAAASPRPEEAAAAVAAALQLQQQQQQQEEQHQRQQQQQGLLDKFLSGAGAARPDAPQLPGGATPQLAGRGDDNTAAAEGLTLTVKIAGVHWWYNSTSHASELTAGYYNTTTRDGYTPLLELCARHGANVTLTCVEMSDDQHPRHALCGPEGLLRQIRATAARLGVTLSGENALRIFLVGGGIDATALGRIVDNTRAWALGLGPVGGGGSSGALARCSGGGRSVGGGYGYGHGGGYGGHGYGYNSGAVPLRSVASWPCAPMVEQQLQQQQQHYAYPGQYAYAGGAASEAAGVGRRPGWPPPQQQQQQSGFAMYGGSSAYYGSSGDVGSAGGYGYGYGYGGLGQRSSSNGGALAGGGGGGSGIVLPPLRSFTFLRLGPELLDHQADWLSFMYKMQNGRT